MIAENNGYRYYYNSLGQLSWVTLIATKNTVYVPNSPTYTAENNPDTAQFLATDPDLSDHPEFAEEP